MKDKAKQRELIRFALLVALFSWAILCYGKLGELMYKGTLFARMLDGRAHVSDFVNHYNAGVLAERCLRGDKVKIYDIDVQNESLKALIAPIVPEQPFYLQYPPYFFTLALPLRTVPMPIAWLAWNIFGTTLCVFGLNRLAKSVGMAAKEAAMLIAVAFCSYPAWLTCELGQTSIYLVAAAAYTLALLKERRAPLAGISAAFLMVKLQYAPIFLAIGLLTGRLRFAIAYSIAMLILIGISAAMLGIDNLISYPQALLAGETGREVSGVSAYMMQNIRGELVLLLRDNTQLIKSIVLPAFAIGTLFSTFLIFQATKKDKAAEQAAGKAAEQAAGKAAEQAEGQAIELAGLATAEGEGQTAGDLESRGAEESASKDLNLNRSIAISLMIALIVSPHTHTQDYLLLVIPAILLLRSFPNDVASTKRIRSWFLNFVPLSWLFFYIQPFMLLVSMQLSLLYLLAICVVVFLSLKHSENISR